MTLAQALIGESVPPRDRERYRDTSPPSSRSRARSGRCWAAISPSISAGAGYSRSTSRSGSSQRCSLSGYALGCPRRGARSASTCRVRSSSSPAARSACTRSPRPASPPVDGARALRAAVGRGSRSGRARMVGASCDGPADSPAPARGPRDSPRQRHGQCCSPPRSSERSCTCRFYLQLAHRFAVGESGLLLLPITLAVAVSSTLTGRAISRSGRLTVYPSAGSRPPLSRFVTLAATMRGRARLARARADRRGCSRHGDGHADDAGRRAGHRRRRRPRRCHRQRVGGPFGRRHHRLSGDRRHAMRRCGGADTACAALLPGAAELGAPRSGRWRPPRGRPSPAS